MLNCTRRNDEDVDSLVGLRGFGKYKSRSLVGKLVGSFIAIELGVGDELGVGMGFFEGLGVVVSRGTGLEDVVVEGITVGVSVRIKKSTLVGSFTGEFVGELDSPPLLPPPPGVGGSDSTRLGEGGSVGPLVDMGVEGILISSDILALGFIVGVDIPDDNSALGI